MYIFMYIQASSLSLDWDTDLQLAAFSLEPFDEASPMIYVTSGFKSLRIRAHASLRHSNLEQWKISTAVVQPGTTAITATTAESQREREWEGKKDKGRWRWTWKGQRIWRRRLKELLLAQAPLPLPPPSCPRSTSSSRSTGLRSRSNRTRNFLLAELTLTLTLRPTGSSRRRQWKTFIPRGPPWKVLRWVRKKLLRVFRLRIKF